ncbi:MAG TPA: hypothetical protein VGR00_01825, partial [Thermoanaerobaculia bacterium]|nr:hypothetical protein [Thermoanaerobaculia bacterium]
QAKKLLDERASRIKALQSRLKGSEAQLKQVMDLLTRLMVERAEEVARLDEELGKLRGEKHAVEEERDAAKKAHAEEAAKRQEAETALDTAYVAIGTEDELRTRGILSVEKKGVLGMKKRIGLAPITSYEPFQKLSIQKDREFKLGKVKSYQAASGHDLKGGCTKQEAGGETTLVVNDPKTFWTEKVLVIVVTR